MVLVQHNWFVLATAKHILDMFMLKHSNIKGAGAWTEEC